MHARRGSWLPRHRSIDRPRSARTAPGATIGLPRDRSIGRDQDHESPKSNPFVIAIARANALRQLYLRGSVSLQLRSNDRIRQSVLTGNRHRFHGTFSPINRDRDRDQKNKNPIAIAKKFFQTRSSLSVQYPLHVVAGHRFHWTFFPIYRDRDRIFYFQTRSGSGIFQIKPDRDRD